MGNMQATPRNRIVGGLADALKSGKSAMDQYEMKKWVPLIGGAGLGEMFMGKAPELLDDISYDGLQAAMRGGNLATGGIGTYGARPAVADAALLGADALGIGKGIGALTKAGGKAAGNALMDGATELGRREFMKKVAALSAAAATTGSGVGVLRKLGKETGEVVANTIPKIADNVASTTTKYKFNTLNDYFKDVIARAADEVEISWAESGGIGEIPEKFYRTAINNYTKDYLTHDLYVYKKGKAFNDPQKYSVTNDGQLVSNFGSRSIIPDHEARAIDTVNHFSPEAKKEMQNFKQELLKRDDTYWEGYFQDKRIIADDELNSRMESSGMDLQDYAEMHNMTYDDAYKQLGILSDSDRTAIRDEYKKGVMKKRETDGTEFDVLGNSAFDYIADNKGGFKADIPF